MINFEHLEAFVNAAKYGSFSKAARRMGKAQSSISTHVAMLEDSLGYKVFTRGHKISLTNKGEILYRQALNILWKCNDFESLAISLHDTSVPIINIGIDFSIYKRSLFKVLKEFSLKFKHCQLNLMPISSADVKRKLEKNELDLALYFSYEISDTYNCLTLRKVINKIIVAKTHPLAREESISYEILKEYLQIVITNENTELDKAMIFSDKYYTVNNYYYALSCVAEGIGFAIVPEDLLVLEKHFKNSIVFIDDRQVNFQDSYLALSYKEVASDFKEINFLINSFKKIFKKDLVLDNDAIVNS